ncbi:MAG: hypothetical protein H7336_12695 [Bacteriovorax sp.]|nr:hypothetical protein [Bacteriovorax sp.]
MQKDHLEDLKILQKKDRSIKYGIALSYNTNLMKEKEFILQWVTILNQFKNPGIMISVDSVGRLNDLIRMGSSFNKLQENLNIINENKKPHLRMHIDLTMTSLFFFNLIEYSQWIVENKYNLNARVMINQFSGKFLYFEILPLEFREKKLREWVAWLELLPKEDQDRLGNLRNVLETYYSTPAFCDEERMLAEDEIRRVCAKQYADEIMAHLGPYLPSKPL